MSPRVKEKLFFGIWYLLLVFAVLLDGAFFLHFIPVPLIPRPGMEELVILAVGGAAIWFIYMIPVLIIGTFVPDRYPKRCQSS